VVATCAQSSPRCGGRLIARSRPWEIASNGATSNGLTTKTWREDEERAPSAEPIRLHTEATGLMRTRPGCGWYKTGRTRFNTLKA